MGLLRSTCGFDEVTQAGDGQEVVDLFNMAPYDLVVLDWEMPIRSGLDVLKILRAKGSKIPIVMCTSLSSKAAIVEAIAAGASGYIVKPYQPNDVEERLKQVMAQAHAAKQVHRVLLVDDSSTIRTVVGNILKKMGHFDEVLEAEDGRQALELLRQIPVDLILLDWNMPVLDGLSTLREFRTYNTTTRVVMVTTEASGAQLKDAIAAGVNGYVVKPFEAEALRARVEKVMEGVPGFEHRHIIPGSPV